MQSVGPRGEIVRVFLRVVQGQALSHVYRMVRAKLGGQEVIAVKKMFSLTTFA